MSRKRDPRARLYLHRDELDELLGAVTHIERILSTAQRGPVIAVQERRQRLDALRGKLQRARAKIPS